MNKNNERIKWIHNINCDRKKGQNKIYIRFQLNLGPETNFKVYVQSLTPKVFQELNLIEAISYPN